MNKFTVKELRDNNHPYYCSESNYYSNEAAMSFETMGEFLDVFEGADVDMNLVFRWDVYAIRDDIGQDVDGYCAEVFIIQQRKGRFIPVSVSKFDDSEVDRFVEYLKKHHETIKELWKPF